MFSQRYERGSALVTTNLPFDEWTEVFGSGRLNGALLGRLKRSRRSAVFQTSDEPDAVYPTIGPLFIFPYIPSHYSNAAPCSPYRWVTIPLPQRYTLPLPFTRCVARANLDLHFARVSLPDQILLPDKGVPVGFLVFRGQVASPSETRWRRRYPESKSRACP